MDEDLHSCIIENLERNNMNNRANIMYFLDHFCDMAVKEHHIPYVDMVRRDIERIVAAVAQSGANFKVVRKVVGDLGGKGILADSVVRSIEEGLRGRDEETGRLLKDDQSADGRETADRDAVDGSADEIERKAEPDSTHSQSHRPTPRTGGASATHKQNGVVPKVDKRVIEQRIEEDRERNKRLRESVWAVTGDDADELDKMWEEGSEMCEDDLVLADEETEERRQFARYHRSQLEV